jgi:mediator of RNA polymerase II transcription subunit 8
MDREDKTLEMAMDVIITRCADIKNSLASFIYKLENEHPADPVNWAVALDNFALISSQINNLMKILRNEKTPPLRNRLFLPLALHPERDEELCRLTDNRVQAFNHEMVPNYLRTKPEPDIEEKERTLYQRSNSITADAGQKQITAINKIATSIIELVKSARDEWDNETHQKSSQQPTSNPNDTNMIIAAISSGKGLRPGSELPPTPKPGPPQMVPGMIGQQQAGQKAVPGKTPAAIKTNIKSHPYNRGDNVGLCLLYSPCSALFKITHCCVL